MMKEMVFSAVMSAVAVSVSGGDAFRGDPGKHWDFSTLEKAPAYHDAGFPDSEAKGLRAIMYEGMPVKGVKAPVFAYIGYPDGPAPDGGFPGMVLVHGGGGTAYAQYANLWRNHGYAVICIDWYNQRPSPQPDGSVKQLPLEGGKRQDHVANTGNIVLAHSLLRSLPNVNKDKTGFIGISWGSWYGAMVTAVDPRFKIMIEVYCGGVNRNSADFINGRFLHAAKCPMYWIAGTNDQNITMEHLQAAFSETPTLVNRTLVAQLPHSHIGYTFDACFRVADSCFMGGTMLPKLADSEIKDGVISAKVLGQGKGIKRCILTYTTDSDVRPWHKMVWKTIPAALKDGSVSVKLPDGVFQCFLTAYDEDGADTHCGGTSDVKFFPKK